MTASYYETSNVYLAAFLLCQGATLAGYERVSPRRHLFRFAADERLHELLRIYWGNVPFTLIPTRLFDSLRRLKSRVRVRPELATPGGASKTAAAPRADAGQSGHDSPTSL